MTVYRLIQKLAKYDAMAEVRVDMFGETPYILEDVSKDSADGRVQTQFNGSIYDIKDVGMKEVRITVAIY